MNLMPFLRIFPLFCATFICTVTFPENYFATDENNLSMIKCDSIEAIHGIVRSQAKPGMIYFYTETCGWCRIMEEITFRNDTVLSALERNFLIFDGHNRNLETHFGVVSYPQVIFIEALGEVLERVKGYVPKDEFMKVLERINSLENTISHLKKMYENNPENNLAAIRYADRLLNAGDFKNAVTVYENNLIFSNVDSIRMKACYNIGRASQAIGSFRKAISYWKCAVDSLAFNYYRNEILSRLGEILFQEEEDFANTIKYLNRCNWKNGNVADRNLVKRIPLYLGISYLKTGEEERGKELLARTLSEFHKTKEYHMISESAVRFKYHNVYLPEAVSLMEKCSKDIQGDSAYFYFAYSELLFRFKSYKKALDITKIAIVFDKNSASSTHNYARLAILYDKLGDTGLSEETINEILGMAKYNPDILLSLAGTYIEEKMRVEEALSWAKKYIESSGDSSPHRYWYYGHLLYQTGHVQEAIEITKSVIARLPDRDFYKMKLEQYLAAARQ